MPRIRRWHDKDQHENETCRQKFKDKMIHPMKDLKECTQTRRNWSFGGNKYQGFKTVAKFELEALGQEQRQLEMNLQTWAESGLDRDLQALGKELDFWWNVNNLWGEWNEDSKW